MQSQKQQSELSSFPSQTIQSTLIHFTVIQVYASTINAREAEVEWFYEDLRPSRTNSKKKKKKEREREILFIKEDWNAKVGSQEIPGVPGTK